MYHHILPIWLIVWNSLAVLNSLLRFIYQLMRGHCFTVCYVLYSVFYCLLYVIQPSWLPNPIKVMIIIITFTSLCSKCPPPSRMQTRRRWRHLWFISLCPFVLDASFQFVDIWNLGTIDSLLKHTLWYPCGIWKRVFRLSAGQCPITSCQRAKIQ